MNKLYLLLVFLLSTFMDIQGQVVAVKTNVLYDAITTPNVGAEVAFNQALVRWRHRGIITVGHSRAISHLSIG